MTEIKNLKYNAEGLIPAIVQHYQSKEVLMLAYMNEESIRLTLRTGKTWFWSRSRQKLWNKGESSGHFQYVKDIFIDCDQDTLLILVDQIGPACHTGSFSCFYRRFNQ
ncbi:phosphoribosyl-AMP cyclohydrolase [Clostridium thermarum]|uniref:phosphoribosyl-AMP cyclohydrolase n=1 Tax=Clostridium thermarum TaxID=1716543 RepID=UPI0011214F55|nr:phosphoribosyl-AMP cyclohydrolase [Clostridium thermarum]